MTPALKQRSQPAACTAAEQAVARLDSYTQDTHSKGIRAARQRREAKKAARRQAAREAVLRLSSAS